MRRGFTLVELIFVIVIIGVLSAVAVPKFKSLKQSAEASSVLKVANDAYTSIPAAYVNIVDLDENKTSSNVLLTDLVSISGKGWAVATGTQNAQTAIFTDSGSVATLTFDPSNRNVRLEVVCSNFTDDLTNKKCGKILTGTATADETSDTNTSF